MNLYELIQRIPDFISDVTKNHHEQAKKAEGEKAPKMIGKFHLGLQYDMNIWHSN